MTDATGESRDLPRRDENSATIGRRQVLQLVAGTGIVGGFAASAAGCRADHATPPSPATVHTLAEADFALLSQLTSLIIPKTDTAGAIEAGVPDFIDAALATGLAAELARRPGSSNAFLDNLPALFADGLKWINTQAQSAHGKDFLALAETEQFALLEPAYRAVETGDAGSRSAQFLQTLKTLTVVGYYTSRQGLLEELNYQGNTAHSGLHGGCTEKSV